MGVNSTMNDRMVDFGDVSDLIMLGGGSLLPQVADKAKDLGASVLVVTSQRHCDESVDLYGAATLGAYLEARGIDFVVSADVNSDEAVLQRIAEGTLGISFGAAWIFNGDFIDRFAGRLINLHGSRLPQDKGGGGFSWRIMRGDRKGYVLFHQVAPGIDEGDIIAYDEFLYPHSCRIPIDYERYTVERYLDLFAGFFADIKGGKSFTLTPQQGYFSSYWPRLHTDSHGYVDWNWSLEDLERFVCAFDEPYSGASTFLDGKRVRLKQCVADRGDGHFHPFQTGIVYRTSREGVFVVAGEGSLIIGRVIDDAGEEITVRVGSRFSTPVDHLQEALQQRVFYTPQGLKEDR